MKKTLFEMHNVRELAAAVIIQAANDLFMSKRALKTGHKMWRNIRNCESTAAACEEFFHSNWCNELLLHADITPKALYEKILADVEDTERIPENEAIYGNPNQLG